MRTQPVTSNRNNKTLPVLLAFVLLACSSLLVISFDTGAMLPSSDPPAPEPIITDGPLGGPVRMANFNKRLFLVADYSNKAILFIKNEKTDVIQKQFSVAGMPQEVERVSRNIIVMNRTSWQLEVYSLKGSYKYALNEQPGTDPNITGIAGDSDDNLVFAVSSSKREVQVYRVRNSNSLLYTFGSDILLCATGIAVDPDNRLVYVGDYGDYISDSPSPPVIHVFDYSGQLINQLQGPDFGFVKPQGLTLTENLLYVADCHNGNVKVIDLDYMTLAGIVGEYGSDDGQSLLVMDVAVDRKFVYILDYLLGRVQKFKR